MGSARGDGTRGRNPAATVGALIDEYARALDDAGCFFGHGTGNARDEAASLVFHVMQLDHAEGAAAYAKSVANNRRRLADALLQRRIDERIPLPYLTNEAWFAGLPFHVDQRVLIPRSPFAELIASRFEPWIEAGSVRRILEIGTGSGCMAVACALAFPDAGIVATDISADALEVARLNVARHGVGGRVEVIRSDLFAEVTGVFDLILSNPPYVAAEEVESLPPEYTHEPRLALESGEDGMETPARILHHAARFLAPEGWLALEVGGGAALLEDRFPRVPFLWPEFIHGGDGIALAAATDLRALECPATP